jgi:hypothetical protein
MPDSSYDALVADLRMLGRTLPAPAGDGDPTLDRLTTAVLSRLADAPVPAIVPTGGVKGSGGRYGGWLRRVLAVAARRRRRLLIVVAVVLLGFLGVPGVRAAVLDWFGFDGVVVHIRPMPDPTVTPIPPAARGNTSLDRARSLVRFQPFVLPALGPPQAVEVSADRRVLSLSWTDPKGATIRLDQFDGRLDYTFAKTASGVEWTTIAGTKALWFEKPHNVVVLDAAGNPRSETARLAGHTLIWEKPGTVLRLEGGDFTRERAVELAESAESLP